jgi:carboxymethylenebutenolidase
VGEDLTARTITITGHGGDEIDAYLVTSEPADGAQRRGGVVLIHHLPGWDWWSKETARRIATFGYDVVAPNLHHREAPGADPDDASAAVRAAGGVPDERLVGDVSGAAEHLRGLPSSNGKVGVIGYCSGGRQSVLAATELDLQAAVDCYGAYVTGTPPADFPIDVTPLTDRIGRLQAPLLGLFGNDDQHPSPAHVDELEKLLTEHGKEHEIHRYDGAGHAFFAVNRPAYRVEAAGDGWSQVRRWFDTHLS